jgi:hypothetical protein
LAAVRRLALPGIALVALLAACGGGSGHSTSTTQIKRAYTTFFSGNSSVTQRVAVLQDGPRFAPVVHSFASNPAAKRVSVDVSSVTLEGANKAKVVYTVKLGNAALPTQTGSAVRQNGRWKVGYASLCRLVALSGSTPAACKP